MKTKRIRSLKVLEFEEKLTSLKISQGWLFIGSAPLASPPQKECKLSLRIKFETAVEGSKN